MAHGLMSPSFGDVYSLSLMVHCTRRVESIAATSERPEQESNWQMPKTSSARHPSVVHTRARPILVALQDGAG